MNRAKIEDVLLAMGVPAGIKGFVYIADAIEIFDERGTDISITKELYPEIAKKNKTTSSRVKRAIRHAFEVTRNEKGDRNKVEKYIGFMNCNNSSSLKMLYSRIKRECKEIEKEKTVLRQEETGAEINSDVLRKIIREELGMFFGRLNEDKT